MSSQSRTCFFTFYSASSSLNLTNFYRNFLSLVIKGSYLYKGTGIQGVQGYKGTRGIRVQGYKGYKGFLSVTYTHLLCCSLVHFVCQKLNLEVMHLHCNVQPNKMAMIGY